MQLQNNFDFILFGATGDLAMRKLLPSLYSAHCAGLLHPKGRILGVSRSQLTTDDYIARVKKKVPESIEMDEQYWASFLNRIQFQKVDVGNNTDFRNLRETLSKSACPENIIFYLSTSPSFFAPICTQLAQNGLNGDNIKIVVEKPLGVDLASAKSINTDIRQHFKETQIYRIDHYLGKESIQNVLALRFDNIVFEPLWNNQFIDSVQLSVTESLGVEERGEFYDAIGALRDMVQNHIMQMLCFTAMEKPNSLQAKDIHAAKLAVIQSLKPLDPQKIDQLVIRGQYTEGLDQEGQSISAYNQEPHVPKDSKTETYVALKAEINNDRWRGVPFYFRTGKKIGRKATEIIINFKALDNPLFQIKHAPDRIVINLHATEPTVELFVHVKTLGTEHKTEVLPMTLHLSNATGRLAGAYERLILNVIDGNQALFNPGDELEAAWAWVMPILDHWSNSNQAPYPYSANSQGPEQAKQLMSNDHRAWHEDQPIY